MFYKKIFIFWLPLAFSWLLMTVAGPWVQAVIGRQADAETQLAAFGLVMSLSVTVEAPIIMLLATSTALVHDAQSYRLLWRYMVIVNIVVTIIAGLFAFSPLLDVWLDGLLGVPRHVQEAVRPGMVIMLLWSAAIGYRRFYQGVLINAEETNAIGTGTVIRIIVSAAAAVALGVLSGWSGVVIGSFAMVSSVIVEAVYTYWRSKSAVEVVQRTEAKSGSSPLSYATALRFHLPLAITSLLSLLVRPLLERGLASTDNAESALAAWSVVFSIALMLRAGGFAYQEVVIALSRTEDETHALYRFAWWMGIAFSVATFIVGFTPLIDLYAGPILSVPENVRPLVVEGTRAIFLLPLLNTLQSYLRAMLMRTDTTQPIYQAMVISLIVTGVAMWAGVEMGMSGILAASVAITAALLAETVFLAFSFRQHAVKLQKVWGDYAVIGAD